MPSDVVEGTPGEYFPADGLLVSGKGMQVDESTVTGESLLVAKHALTLTFRHLPKLATRSFDLLVRVLWMTVVGRLPCAADMRPKTRLALVLGSNPGFEFNRRLELP